MSDRSDGAAEREGNWSAAPELCAACGDAIDTSEWHPVVARNDGGAFRVYPFCDETCRANWHE